MKKIIHSRKSVPYQSVENAFFNVDRCDFLLATGGDKSEKLL